MAPGAPTAEDGANGTVSCSLFPFQNIPLGAALRRIQDLGFERADLPLYHLREWCHITVEDVRRDPVMSLAQIQTAQLASGVTVSSIQVHTDPLSNSERGDFEAVCNLASRLGVGLVSTFALLKDEWLARNRMKDFLIIARERKLTLSIETAPPSFAVDPEAAYRLVSETPGLFLTLNPANLTAYGHPAVTWTQLFPFVRQCYVRDGGHTPDLRQVPWGKGEVDWEFVVNGLKRANYQGDFVIEYIGPRVEDTIKFDPEPEIVKAREALQKLVAGIR